MKIEIQKMNEEEIEKRNVKSWPIWKKEISRFDWYYDDTEECFLLEVKVIVETQDGEKVEFGKGDYVTFPKGLSCVWDIREPVKKHYTFK
ncbi:cupin domain-containing protein [Thermodesulfobacteriota bacterium]